MPASPLQKILAKYRATSQTEREKGSYFEELIRTYFRYEASYADLYSDVWLFADWAKEIGTPEFGISAKDTGIDLVAKTRGTEEYHAIQCKCYDEHHRIMRRDIDSFFTASGRKPFTQRIIVIFSTYHSLDVISRAQKKFGLPEFDLVICDEAHRTTRANFSDSDDKESNFVRVHDNAFLAAKKRLYMTATPRIYADSAKAQAEKENIAICSMDDEALYGKQFHVITFSEAVEQKLLTDYKVLVLTISEDHVSSRLQSLLKDENNQLKVDDAARIIGCWKALSKQGLSTDLAHDPQPMKRAVAFCQVIERQMVA